MLLDLYKNALLFVRQVVNINNKIKYTGSQNNRQIFHGQVERTKLSRKILYHFAIVNKILIIKNYRKLIFNFFTQILSTINFAEKLQETKIVYFFS